MSGAQQISQSKNNRFCVDIVANTHIGNCQKSGFAAGSRLTHLCRPYGASLSFETVTHLWLPPDQPSRVRRYAQIEPVLRFLALASSVLGSLCQGPRVGFVFTHLQFVVHVCHTTELAPCIPGAGLHARVQYCSLEQ